MIKVTHNCGFFSCCSVKLHYIIEYFNKEKTLPEKVDSSEQFLIYKPLHMLKEDITYHFFKELNNTPITYTTHINYTWNSQFEPFTNLDFQSLKPFIDKYFSPSNNIEELSYFLKNKYNIDFENCCGVYFRGTDKYKETKLPSILSYIEKMKTIHNKLFLVQSDDIHFINSIKIEFPNCIIIEENIISSTKNGIHNEHSFNENYHLIHYFFATLLILSKCNTLICNTSNCSLWMALYRNSSSNIFLL